MNKNPNSISGFYHFFKKLFKGDKYIYWIIAILLAFSVPILLASTGPLAHKTANGVVYIPLLKQWVFTLTGVIFMGVLSNLNIKYIRRYIPLIFLISAIGIIVAFFINYKKGSTGRVLDVFGHGFQITEFAKLIIVLFSAYILGQYQKTDGSRKKGFYKTVYFIAIPLGFIILSDFSTFSLITFSVFIVMFLAKSPFKEIGKVAAIAIAIFSVLVIFADAPVIRKIGRFQTIQSRFLTFVAEGKEKEENIDLQNIKLEQIDYSKIAINRGGLLGKNDKSMLSNYLAASYNDFVFAMVNELIGIVGAVFIWIMYLFFFIRIYKLMTRIPAQNNFEMLVVGGLGSIYFLQAMANMAVSIDLIPVTGQPLPFISQGGTSALSTGIAMGIIQSIAYSTHIEALKAEDNDKNRVEIEEAERIDEVFNNLPEENYYDLL